MKYPEIKKYYQPSSFVLGFITCLILLSMIYADRNLDKPIYNNFWSTVWHWQTLIAGVLALFGGLYAVYYTMSHERRVREGLKAYTKSIIPISCVEILEYLQQHIDCLYIEARGKPLPPVRAMDQIAKLIQVTDEKDEEARNNLYKICCHYQVIQSRLNTKDVSLVNKESLSADLIVFGCYIYALLAYVRGSFREADPNEFKEVIQIDLDRFSQVGNQIVGAPKLSTPSFSNLKICIEQMTIEKLENKSNYDYFLSESEGS